MMLKSTTSIVIVREWLRGPLTPTTVTVYVCTRVELTVKVDLPGEPAVRTTLPWLRLWTRPMGVAEDERRIVPE